MFEIREIYHAFGVGGKLFVMVLGGRYFLFFCVVRN
jgi:hypothetical protein